MENENYSKEDLLLSRYNNNSTSKIEVLVPEGVKVNFSAEELKLIDRKNSLQANSSGLSDIDLLRIELKRFLDDIS